MKDRILVVGSLNVDLVCRVPRLPSIGETVSALGLEEHCGGKGANQACGAARLGGRVSLLGCVGQDDHGRRLLDALRAVDVDVSPVDVIAGEPSGLALISVDREGQNQIVVVPGANAHVTPARLAARESLFASAAVVLLQLEIPLETVRRAARMGRAAGAAVVLDPAPAMPLPADLLADIDYLTPNEGELRVLTEGESSSGGLAERARLLLARGPGAVLVKRGRDGALLVTREGEHRWKALPVDAVDTTAAGDTFNAAFAVGLTHGWSHDRAGVFACTAAGLSVSRRGAQASMPTSAEVAAVLEGGRDVLLGGPRATP